MKSSLSNMKPALSSFNPQGTSTPGVSRVGGAILLSVGNKIGGPCKSPKVETTSFGRARHEKEHGAGMDMDD